MCSDLKIWDYLYGMTSFLDIRELLPKLPSDGVFAIDAMLRKGPNLHNEAVLWQWQDDRAIWHSYTPIDSKIIEVCEENK